MVKDRIKVGHCILKNRMVKAPIYSDSCVKGRITEDTIRHYEDRTGDGRFGLVVIEHSFVRQDGMAGPAQLSAADDRAIEDIRKLCEIIHRNGSAAILQINHGGCAAEKSFCGCDPVSPSGISISCGLPGSKPNTQKPGILTKNEILALEDAYIRAARRGMEAGCDGIEIHSAHGYMLNQFYSPISNKRTDQYNGYTLEGRTRIHREIIRGVRQAIGDQPLLAIRIGGCDYMEGGTRIEDTVEASKAYEELGVDLIDISGGLCSFVRPGHTEPGYFGEISEAVKKEVGIPVLLTGGVKTLADADMLLEQGKADLIGVGRIITAQADWGRELLS